MEIKKNSKNKKKFIYKCPVCDSELNRFEKQYICCNNHSFDISRKGYVNLLLVNQKKTKQPGDNKEMVESRSRFLDKGYYSCFSDKLNEIISERLNGENLNILDAGCGDGYFISRLKNKLMQDEKRKHIDFYGIDISKFAAAYGSKRDKEINFVVGSTFNLPIMSNTFDCIIRNFAPGDNEEFHRILKNDGRLIVITPGVEHLFGLKEKLYEKARKHENKQLELEKFEFVERLEIKYTVHINDSEEVRNLISMTPYYWSISDSVRDKIDEIDKIETVLNFIVSIYKKK